MFNKEKILNQLRAELKERPIIQYAVKKCGISRSQFYKWMQDDKNFAEKINEAMREGTAVVNDFSVSKLLTGITNDNLAAVFFWLRHRHPDFSNKLEITAKHEVIRSLSDAEKKIIEQALKLSGLSNQERDELNNLLNSNHHEQT